MSGSTTLLLVGGARSGKSRLAVDLARSWPDPVTFVATATAGDDDMADRIAQHQAERPEAWHTVEAPTGLTDALRGVDAGRALVVDCITMWAANEMLAGAGHDEVLARAEQVADTVVARPTPAVVVTNEVGSGVVPGTEAGRDFRDLLGGVNRVLAERLEASYLVVAGQLVELRRPHDVFDRLGPA